MEHIDYGTITNVYYRNDIDTYYVRFRRRGQYFLSPQYKTVEEAIKARNYMQQIIPKSCTRKYGRHKISNYDIPTWLLSKFLKGEEQEIACDKPLNLKEHASKNGVLRYANLKQKQAVLNEWYKYI